MTKVYLIEIQEEDINPSIENLEEELAEILQTNLGLTLDLNLSIQEIEWRSIDMTKVYLIEIQEEDINPRIEDLEEELAEMLQTNLGLTLDLNLSIHEIE